MEAIRPPRESTEESDLIRTLALGFLSICLSMSGATPGYAQDREAGLTIGHLAGNIYWLNGGGGNTAVSSGPDGFMLVDCKVSAVAGQVRDGRIFDMFLGGVVRMI